MGLDMYLYKRTYVKNWEHTTPENKYEISIKMGGKETDINTNRISEVTEEVAYWRKANAIHNWFMKNCADDEQDNNGEDIYVSDEKLQELLDTCNKVIEASKLVKGKIANGQTYNPKTGKWKDIMEDGEYIEDSTVAEKLLPTQSGFFFGSTDYDQYYFEDVKYTRDMLDKLLKEPNDDISVSYYYSANW